MSNWTMRADRVYRAASLAINPNTNMIYAISYTPPGERFITITDPYTHSLTTLPPSEVGLTTEDHPTSIAVNPNTNKIYVANSGSRHVSVIDGKENKIIKKVSMPILHPKNIIVNPNDNIIYVSNSGSDTVTVIDGTTDTVMVGVTFNINPFNSGHIKCNNKEYAINQYNRIVPGTQCNAEANNGYQFSNWAQNLGKNSSRTISTSTQSLSWLDSLSNTIGLNPNHNKYANLSITQFGNFTANFEKVPPPIPLEYWIPLYGVIVSSIVGWSIPSILGWVKTKRQIRIVNQYHRKINSLYADDNKLDENDIKKLDALKTDIKDVYTKGKISDLQYNNLKNEISGLYERIYNSKIDSLNGKVDRANNRIQLSKIKDDLIYAYAEGKITEQHYNLLKDKIPNNDNNNDTTSSKG